jgi:outer membrane receptor protein involved in Fe transport
VPIPQDDEWQLARREAAETLQDVLGWNLRPARWEQVRAALAAMTAAATASGPAGLQEATETLEFLAPVRVGTRLGAESPEPAPGSVREQVAELVETLRPNGPAGGLGQAGSGGQAARRGA